MALSPQCEAGDPLPNFKLEDQQGRVHVLANAVSGKAVVLLVFPSSRYPACQQLLRSFIEIHSGLEARAHLFAITNDPPGAGPAAAGRTAPFPILFDHAQGFARAAGFPHNVEEPQDFMGAGAFSVVVADPNLRVLKVARGVTDGAVAAETLAFLDEALAIEPLTLPRAAPVLRVPGALSPDFCRRLIAAFESGETVSTGTLRDGAAGVEESRDRAVKRRRDHFVREPGLKGELEGLIGRRVVPEIAKAFHYQVTRFDHFKVGCYDAEGGGYFRPHRDNNSASGAHRRFAMSLNLNADEYEGGDLRFAEFGPHLYRPETGEAIVFSCSLLHEATPVTAGRRFVLLSFFFGEAERQMLALRTVGRRP